MGTRCNILIDSYQFYHHYDGYPDGVGADLAGLISHINAGRTPSDYSFFDGDDATLNSLAYGIATHGLMRPSGFDTTYQSEEFGLHGDIEYLYIVKGEPPETKIYCLDVNEYIRKNSADGSAWGEARDNSPLWKMSPEELERNFCKRKYLMELPPVEYVPEDQRRYLLRRPLTYQEAMNTGYLDDELKWGEENEHSLLRINNKRGRKSGKLRRLFSRRR